MLKKRLARLEQSIQQQQSGEQKLYMVFRDEEKDLMEIADLSFHGTVEDGRRLMEQFRNDIFVIWDWDMRAHNPAQWAN